MTKHFAFVSLPAAGHINPTIPLVEELVRRGHRVTYAGARQSLAGAEKAGAEILDVPFRMPDVPPMTDRLDGAEIRLMMQLMLDNTRTSLPLLLERFAADTPDAVCYDMMTVMGRMAARKHEVPAVKLMPSFASNETFSLRERMTPTAGFDPAHVAEFVRQLQELGEEFGVSAGTGFDEHDIAGLNLSFLPRRFQLEGDSFDERFRFLGPMFGQREVEQWEPRDPGAPLLYISLGTAFNKRPDFYRMCFEAFGGSGWQVALSVGAGTDVSELGQAPANFEVRESFPQLAVLRQASVFLSHTGMNSTMESLYYGVPLVAVPQMPEQALNAARVEELGLGRRLVTDEVTAEQLRAAVEQVSGDEDVRANLADMQRTLRECGGARAGADALESYLA
ncbi:MGT family glycosyltransferase [Saccharopolyspora erythraea NRRL 2338]|uniref:Antibiotic resistance macrolide glycosyltransferase n=2 Tax=Saccharopolyspora erythraea TaxID=1836 RepID=A4FFP8_SACEN|nr:macrolide family glycosyltransferase [Saccharopolyspora erythraea]EQD83142.1 antibiotic resistance macrolide glycosyltransferase [Saccharopolyspora erythraea D]PFG96593.1 MGT family glycosyltransferase [Saccharopolyspora erythraea NRRL 2338]QRK93070.1 glycosyl transferase [Saccharopolyspora erythraea]CAM02873.1 antibiotic resistance macrolide glycosyltransferase [Saccharopolyspora erythraea NRRL 2338]